MKKKLSKKAKRRIVIFSLIGVVAVYFVVSSRVKASQPMMVMTTNAQIGDIDQVLTTSGTVESEQTKTYYSPVGASIMAVNAELGDEIHSGDVLVAYDVADLETAKQQAEYRTQAAVNNYLGTAEQNKQSGGKYEEASTNLDILEQQIAAQRELVKQMKDVLLNKTNEMKNKFSKKDVELQKKLQTEQANLSSAETGEAREQINWRIRNIQSEITQNSYDLAMVDQNLELRQMQYEIDDAEEVLRKYEEKQTEMKSQKNGNEASQSSKYNAASLNANANESKLSQQIAEENLETAQNGVVAQFDGIVTAISAKEGALATEGMELLEVQSNKEVCVKIEVTKYDLEKVKIGQKADLTIAGNAYEGEISKIYHMATKNAAGSSIVQALIHIKNPDDGIFLGIEAKVRLYTAASKQAILIPNEVINADMNGDFVYVVEEGVVVRKDITTGITSDLYTEVLSGLSTEDQIVLDSSSVTEGMNVVQMPQNVEEQPEE